MLINVKMPTIVGILTSTSRKILCSAELSMKKVFNWNRQRVKLACPFSQSNSNSDIAFDSRPLKMLSALDVNRIF